MKIKVRIQKVYGVDRIYPVCTKGKVFALLIGQKTFNDDHVKWIKSLGFEVEVETPSL